MPDILGIGRSPRENQGFTEAGPGTKWLVLGSARGPLLGALLVSAGAVGGVVLHCSQWYNWLHWEHCAELGWEGGSVFSLHRLLKSGNVFGGCHSAAWLLVLVSVC